MLGSEAAVETYKLSFVANAFVAGWLDQVWNAAANATLDLGRASVKHILYI